MVDGPNLYAYVRDNPVGLIDPNGTDAFSALSDWVKYDVPAVGREVEHQVGELALKAEQAKRDAHENEIAHFRSPIASESRPSGGHPQGPEGEVSGLRTQVRGFAYGALDTLLFGQQGAVGLDEPTFEERHSTTFEQSRAAGSIAAGIATAGIGGGAAGGSGVAQTTAGTLQVVGAEAAFSQAVAGVAGASGIAAGVLALSKGGSTESKGGQEKPATGETRESAENAGLRELDIDRYGNFGQGHRKGDQLAGHEVLQNAWLKQQGLLKQRGVGAASRDNPALAVGERLHKAIGAKQRELGLNDPSRLRAMSARENIDLNARALREAGVPEHAVQTIVKEAIGHARGLGVYR
jgi:hypothetical protein